MSDHLPDATRRMVACARLALNPHAPLEVLADRPRGEIILTLPLTSNILYMLTTFTVSVPSTS